MNVEEYGLTLEEMPYYVRREMWLYTTLYGQAFVIKKDNKYILHYTNSDGKMTEKELIEK